MKVKWLGHSAFLITSETGISVLTDPYNVGGGLSYGPIGETVDIVTISHNHADHNNASAGGARAEVIRGMVKKEVKGIRFRGVTVYHDESKGRQRGANTVFRFTLEGLRLCHLGDLGHPLSQEQAKEIGQVDLLLIPVGGFFTIDAAQATQICAQLQPRVVIPMHYKTPRCDYPITGVEEFLKGKAGVRRLGGSEVEMKAGRLPPSMEIVVLEPAL